MPYKKGESGNPKGRAKGFLDARTALSRQLQGSGPKVVEKLIEMALAGDIQAIKIIIERVCPKPRGETINLGFQLNQAIGDGMTRQVVTEALEAAIEGELPEEQGRTIATLVTKLGEIDTKIQSEKRLEVIESKLGIKEV